MKKIDLHVHSKYSQDPGEWALRQMGMNECYIEIEDIYKIAKSQGMDYVTITDHDTVEGSIKLNQLHPDDTIVGVEVTTTFPEDGCKMHVLVYDINQDQFNYIDSIRSNIYTLREYIIKENIAYSVAHVTYAVNGRLSIETFEKLILMFDVFEGINGARNPYFNDTWTNILKSLKPEDIERIYKKYNIEPMSKDPWIKGFTGGSDDHAALFIGRTWTNTNAQTKEEFIANLKNKKTLAFGRSNNYKSMAFIFYKIFNDFTEHGDTDKQNRMIRLINNIVFKHQGPSLKEAYILHRMKLSDKKRERIIARFIDRLDTDLTGVKHLTVEDKINRVYHNISILCDDYVKFMVQKSKKEVQKGNLFKWLNGVSNILSISYMVMPFYLTWKHLNSNRDILEEFKKQYLPEEAKKDKRVLWFTDTLIDLNGVSVTINSMLGCAKNYGVPLKIVTSNPKILLDEEMSQHVINLPSSLSYTSEIYNSYTMNFPSILKSLETVHQEDPQEIIISTPGPVGLLGMLIAKILGIKCTGIYHTDFGAQFDFIMGDDGYSPRLIENYTDWFYKQLDEIRVPTNQYINILQDKGMEKAKLKKFTRGLNTDLFDYNISKEASIRQKYDIREGFTLIYAGRVSKDKNIDFLVDLYKRFNLIRSDVNLIIAGSGPDLQDMKKKLESYPRVTFTGQISRNELAQLYSYSDLMLFPSTTDTFGMVVLEAQSCGLPVLVSNQGGPQEIISDKQTGYVLDVRQKEEWINKILEYIHICEFEPERYIQLRSDIRKRIKENYSWEKALEDLLSISLSKAIKQTPETSRIFYRQTGDIENLRS